MDYIFKIAAINSEIEFLSCSLKECLIQIEKQFPLGDDICMWGETMKKRGESWDEWLLKGDSLPGLIKKRNRIIVEMLEQQQQLMNQHPPQRLQQPPQSQLPQGQIQWIDFSRTEVYGNLQQWLLPRLGFAVFLPPAEKVAITALKRALGAVNTHLASNTYLVGHSVTWADIVMTYNLYWGFKNILTKSFTSEFPHVERYFWNLVKQPKFQKVLGDIKQAESIPPVASKKSVQTKKPGKPKSKKKEAAPRPNSKHPLDLLPPSMMVLDDWKSLYSNTKTNFREVAIKGFWDMYDPEGYSLWFCNYKYNNENTVSFVTLNKVSGFLQQMDLARKYAFGKMLIIGSEPPFKVKGLWLFRGQEILNLMTEVYDMELYDWKQVDINDEGQKELVNQMIEDQDPFEGEALLHAKCFK